MANALKEILNTSEYKTYDLIMKSINHTEFYLLSQTPMNKVIDAEKLNLSTKERKHYNDTTFDFVICGKNKTAELIIEFDGPQHFKSGEQIKSDIRKIKICQEAELPIIRIDDSYLQHVEKISIIEFILIRLCKWHDEAPELQKEYDEYMNKLTDSEWKKSVEKMDYFDYLPDINFNFRYQLTDISGINAYLSKKVGITDISFLNIMNKKSYYQFVSSNPEYNHDGNIIYAVTYKLHMEIKRKGEIKEINEKILASSSLRWYLYSETLEDNINLKQCYYFKIPGTSIPDLCENIAVYKCFLIIKEKCLNLMRDKWTIT
jgi:hypothetical protein